MAKTIKKKNVRTSKTSLESPFGIYWNKNNYYLLLLGFALLLIGFYVMSLGSWDSTASLVLSPVILMIAYILIFPAAIFLRKKEKSRSAEPKVPNPEQPEAIKK